MYLYCICICCVTLAIFFSSNFLYFVSSLLLYVTCIFHWVHPWDWLDLRSCCPALRIVKPLFGTGGWSRESPFWPVGFEPELKFAIAIPISIPSLPHRTLPTPMRFQCVGVSIYCEILKLYKEYLNKTTTIVATK